MGDRAVQPDTHQVVQGEDKTDDFGDLLSVFYERSYREGVEEMNTGDIVLFVFILIAAGGLVWMISTFFKSKGKIITTILGCLAIFISMTFLLGAGVTQNYNPELSQLVANGQPKLITDCFGKMQGIDIGDYTLTRQSMARLNPSNEAHGWGLFRTITGDVVPWVELKESSKYNL
jgi:hypothetical protein